MRSTSTEFTNSEHEHKHIRTIRRRRARHGFCTYDNHAVIESDDATSLCLDSFKYLSELRKVGFIN